MGNKAVAKYIRLSVEDSITGSVSIQSQQHILDHAIRKLGLDHLEILEFVDNGYTGTNFERPAVQRLLEQVQQGGIGCIVVKDFSRFGRDSLGMGYFIDKVFPLFQVRLVSVNDAFDSLEHPGNASGLDVGFKYLIGELYSRDISQKIKSSKYARMKAGEYQSAICCYGYRKGADNRLELDEEAAAVVRLIFALASEGKSSTEIAQVLLEKDIPTPGEYKALQGRPHYDVTRCRHIWQQSTILRILADERYIGTYIMGKRVVCEIGGRRTKLKNEKDWFKIPNHHPPVIERSVFEMVQAKRRCFRCDKKSRQYPLRAKVVCGCCGHSMSRANNKRPAFYCRFTKPDPDAECHNLHIFEDELHDLLLEIIRHRALHLLGALELSAGNIVDVDFRGIAELEQAMQKNKSRKQELYGQFQKKEIGLAKYQSLKAVVDMRLNGLEQAVQDYKKGLEVSRNHQEITTIVKIAVALIEKGDFTQDLSNLLIEKVIIYPNLHLDVEYRIKDF